MGSISKAKDVKDMIPMQPLYGAAADVPSPNRTESGPQPPSYSAPAGDAPPSYNSAARQRSSAAAVAVGGRTPSDFRRLENNAESNGAPLLTTADTRGNRAASKEDLSDGRTVSPPPPLHAQHLPNLDIEQQKHNGFEEHRV